MISIDSEAVLIKTEPEIKSEESGQIRKTMDTSYEERSNHHTKRDRSRSRSPVRRSEREDTSRSRSKSPFTERRRIVSNVSSNKVIVRNIPYETPWQELKDLFRKEVGYVVYVELFKGNDGRPNGMGVIEFRDRETARTAIEKMNKHELMGRAIIVREERDSDKRMYNQNPGGPGGPMGNNGPPMGGGPMGGAPIGGGGMGMGGPIGGGGGMGMGGGGGMGMGGGGGMGMGNMMGGGGGGNTGVSPQLLQQLGIEGPLTNSVFVANLDYKVTWQKLKDVFKLAGKVLKAEIKTDKNGKSRGMGTVLFDLPIEAVQAVSMFSGQSLFDRVMSVKIDNLDDRPPLPSKLPSGLKSIGMGLGSGGVPLQNFVPNYNSGAGMGGGGGMGAGSMGGSSMGGGGMGNMGGGTMGNLGGGLSNMGGNFGMDTSGMGGLGMDNMGGMTNMGGGMSGLGGGMSSMGGGMSGMGGGMANPIGGLTNMGGGLGTGLSGGMGGVMGSGMTGMGRSSNLGMTNNMGLGSGGMGLAGGESYNNMGNLGGDRGPMGMGMDRGGRADSYGDRGRRDDRDRERSSGSLADKGFTTKPDNATVVVKNLPYSTQWKALKERFADVGEVRFAEIKMENGKSTGTGLIRFATQADAERAINVMHKTQIDQREISVRMYR